MGPVTKQDETAMLSSITEKNMFLSVTCFNILERSDVHMVATLDNAHHTNHISFNRPVSKYRKLLSSPTFALLGTHCGC